MSSRNIGIVFGPNILRPHRQDPNTLINTDPARLVEFMLVHYTEIFMGSPEDDNLT